MASRGGPACGRPAVPRVRADDPAGRICGTVAAMSPDVSRSASAVAAAAAGTVLVVDAAARSVLMLRRNDALRVMGGFWVFPGGTVDAADVPAGADAIAAASHAACRELYEEAGLRVEPSALLHWAHWITPSAVRRRFDTHFFLTPRPAGQVARLASAESSEFRWVDVAAALADDSGLPLAPPTALELRALDAMLRSGANQDLLIERVRARRARSVLPKLVDGYAVMPWDAEYASLPGEGIDWDAAARAERAGWPGRLRAVVRAGQ